MKATGINYWLFVTAALLGILAVCPATQAEELTAEDMYLDPAAVSPDNYDYDYYNVGYSFTAANVQSLRVLPVLMPNSDDYYFTPCVDYAGDITGTDGSITFLRPGPYFVEATYVDGSSALFDLGIEFRTNRGGEAPTYNWHKTDTPTGDYIIVDPDLKDSQPDFATGTVVKDTFTTWQQVTDFLKTLNDKHVELSGHGAPGEFRWGGQKVLDASSTDWLNSMKGHVKNLTFMSCRTGTGEVGDTFGQLVADTLGASALYTDVVGGNGEEWFINDHGYRKFFVPEPATLVLLTLGTLVTLRGQRRLAA